MVSALHDEALHDEEHFFHTRDTWTHDTSVAHVHTHTHTDLVRQPYNIWINQINISDNDAVPQPRKRT